MYAVLMTISVILLFVVVPAGLVFPKRVVVWAPLSKRSRAKVLLLLVPCFTLVFVAGAFEPPEVKKQHEEREAAAAAKAKTDAALAAESEAKNKVAQAAELAAEEKAAAEKEALSHQIADPTLEALRVESLATGCGSVAWILSGHALSTIQTEALVKAFDGQSVVFTNMSFQDAKAATLGRGANAVFSCLGGYPTVQQLPIRVEIGSEFKSAVMGLIRFEQYVLKGKLVGGSFEGMHLELTAAPILQSAYNQPNSKPAH